MHPYLLILQCNHNCTGGQTWAFNRLLKKVIDSRPQRLLVHRWARNIVDGQQVLKLLFFQRGCMATDLAKIKGVIRGRSKTAKIPVGADQVR
jgi:hypothetical protein